MQNNKLKETFYSEIDKDKVWIGTFQLAWNELSENIIKNEIKYVNESELSENDKKLVKELNKKEFTKDMIDESSYYVVCERLSPELKNKTETELKNKFNYTTNVLENIDWTQDGYLIYSMLKKEFTFLNPFNRLNSNVFGDEGKKVKYFGISTGESGKIHENVEVLFYNSENDFAVKLNTNENEEVILYRTDTLESFKEYYEEVEEKRQEYKGNREFTAKDNLKVPYINIQENIEYKGLCQKDIVYKELGTTIKIEKATQELRFVLNESGGVVQSEVTMVNILQSINEAEERKFEFNKPFVLFMREKSKENPYLGCRIDTTEFLELDEYE